MARLALRGARPESVHLHVRRGIDLGQLATLADQMYTAGDRSRAESVVRLIYAIGDIRLRSGKSPGRMGRHDRRRKDRTRALAS